MKYLIYGKTLEGTSMIINGFDIEIKRKNVKNINLKVYPNLKISASVPNNMELPSIKRMIISKEKWLNERLKVYEEQLRLSKRKYISGEDHYLNGKRYILTVIDSNKPCVTKQGTKKIIMNVRKSSSIENKEKLMYSFYKSELEKKLNKFIPELENIIGVQSNGYYIRKMKNKWGSCNIENKTLNFNVELAKKKDNEIKYVIVHELIHLIEKKHNDRFKELVENYCPRWEMYHKSLNKLLNDNKIC